MPAYSLGELLSQSTFRTGRHELEASKLSFLANEAAQEVHNALPLSLSEATSHITFGDGETFKPLPTDFGSVIVLSWMSGGSASTLRLQSIDALDSIGTADGLPTDFAFWNNGVEIRPVPESLVTCQLRYRTQWSDMTSEDAVPSSIATSWRPAILYKLQEKVFEAIGDLEAEERARQRYLSFVNSTPTDAQRRQEGQHLMGVRVV